MPAASFVRKKFPSCRFWSELRVISPGEKLDAGPGPRTSNSPCGGVTMTSCQIWFLNTLVDIHVSEADGKDGISVLEHRAPFGDSPPLHVHHTEDEIFHIIDGEFRMNIAGEIRRCGPGGILLAPKGIPHTYRVDSSTGGRWITVTAHGDFERFVRAAGRRAER